MFTNKIVYKRYSNYRNTSNYIDLASQFLETKDK